MFSSQLPVFFEGLKRLNLWAMAQKIALIFCHLHLYLVRDELGYLRTGLPLSSEAVNHVPLGHFGHRRSVRDEKGTIGVVCQIGLEFWPQFFVPDGGGFNVFRHQALFGYFGATTRDFGGDGLNFFPALKASFYGLVIN